MQRTHQRIDPASWNDFKEGKETAFDQLFRAYFAPLTHFAFTILHDEQEAEDVVQDCFVKLWERREDLQQVKEINPYLYQAVRFASYNKLRKAKLHIVKDDSVDVPDEALFQSRIQGEVMAHIAALVERLPEKMRLVLKLHYLEDMSLHDIVKVTGSSYETVRSQRYQALKFIKSILGTAKSIFLSL